MYSYRAASNWIARTFRIASHLHPRRDAVIDMPECKAAVAMITLNTTVRGSEKAAGVTVIAAAAAIYAAFTFAFAVLAFFGAVPLASGAWIVGGGLETLGPVVFVILGAALFATSLGLFALRNWGRWLAIALAVYGIVQTTPAISSAVGDGRIFGIVREGAQIIVRTAALWYLLQENVRDAFR